MNWTGKLENKAFYSKRSRMKLMLLFKKLQYLCRCCKQSHQKWGKKKKNSCFSVFCLCNCLCFVFFSTVTKPDAFTRICLKEGMSPEAWMKLQQDRGLCNLNLLRTDWVGRDQCKFCTWVVFTVVVYSLVCLKVFLELRKSKLIDFMFIADRNFEPNTSK